MKLTPKFLISESVREAGRHLPGRVEPIEAPQAQVVPAAITVEIDE